MNWNAIRLFIFDLGKSLGLRILAAIFIFIIGHKLIKWFKKRVSRPTKADQSDLSARLFIASFSGIALYVMLCITIAMVLGIPTTSFITAIASCGVAIGLAMQGFLSNFAGGIMILIFKPFKVGDYIDAAEVQGTVTEITVVYTILKTPDNKIITIPNGNLTNSVIENYSTADARRVELILSTSYDSDIEKVKGILADIVKSHPLVLSEPLPITRLFEHGESSLNFTVKAWCKTEDYWDVRFDLVEQIKQAFDKNGIEIPYPQMDIHIDPQKR